MDPRAAELLHRSGAWVRPPGGSRVQSGGRHSHTAHRGLGVTQRRRPAASRERLCALPPKRSAAVTSAGVEPWRIGLWRDASANGAEMSPPTHRAVARAQPSHHRPAFGGRDLCQASAPLGSPRPGERMIEHSDELAARAERQADEVAVARLEGKARNGEKPPPGCGFVAPERHSADA